ncbi:MAG: Thioredoxin [Firmicutes bacterium]|nr:Thioredoxin [Bacillota bacterium]
MKIEVFESGCCKPSNVYGLVERAVNESSVNAEMTKVSDTIEAVKRGIIRTPALVIDDKVVCAGRVPEYDEIVNWLSGGKSSR